MAKPVKLPAFRVYNRTWNKVRNRLGAPGQAAPEFAFTGNPTPETQQGLPPGQRPIALPYLTRKLLRNPGTRKIGMAQLVHEFRHEEQPQSLIDAGAGLPYRQRPAEIDAYRFQKETMRSIRQRQRNRLAAKRGGPTASLHGLLTGGS